jgi:hypothetical protein
MIVVVLVANPRNASIYMISSLVLVAGDVCCYTTIYMVCIIIVLCSVFCLLLLLTSKKLFSPCLSRLFYSFILLSSERFLFHSSSLNHTNAHILYKIKIILFCVGNRLL